MNKVTTNSIKLIKHLKNLGLLDKSEYETALYYIDNGFLTALSELVNDAIWTWCFHDASIKNKEAIAQYEYLRNKAMVFVEFDDEDEPKDWEWYL
jgi:hypothetical protein